MKPDAPKSLEERIKELSPDLREEVEQFIRVLLERRREREKASSGGRRLRQDWAGALASYRDRFTSLELKKKALEWRGD